MNLHWPLFQKEYGRLNHGLGMRYYELPVFWASLVSLVKREMIVPKNNSYMTVTSGLDDSE